MTLGDKKMDMKRWDLHPGQRPTGEHLLQDLPNFLVEADGDSVQRAVQTPPAEPLAVSGVPDAGNVLRNIQGLDGRQPVPLKGSRREERLKDLRWNKGLKMEEL